MNHWSTISASNIYIYIVELLMFSLALFKGWVDSFTHLLSKGLFLKQYVKWSFLFVFITPATVSAISVILISHGFSGKVAEWLIFFGCHSIWMILKSLAFRYWLQQTQQSWSLAWMQTLKSWKYAEYTQIKC